MPKKDAEKFRLQLKRLFLAVTLEDMRAFKEDLFTAFADQPKFEKALATLDDGFEDTIQYMNEPGELHVHIRSTNSLERLNQEVRRRERVIRIFPNTQSAFRLIGAVLMHQEKTLYTQKKGLIK